jgi:hypothetical protein
MSDSRVYLGHGPLHPATKQNAPSQVIEEETQLFPPFPLRRRIQGDEPADILVHRTGKSAVEIASEPSGTRGDDPDLLSIHL